MQPANLKEAIAGKETRGSVDAQQQTKASQTELSRMAERVQMMCQLAAEAGRTASHTADRLFGVEPMEATGLSEGYAPEHGSFAHMEACLNELEMVLRNLDRQIERLSAA